MRTYLRRNELKSFISTIEKKQGFCIDGRARDDGNVKK
jgi:hypothetical protein